MSIKGGIFNSLNGASFYLKMEEGRMEGFLWMNGFPRFGFQGQMMM